MSTTTRRAVLAAAPAVAAGTLAAGTAVNAVAVAMTRASEPDPIFALIRAHQDDIKAYLRACETALDDSDPWLADRRLLEVLTVPPTTIAGVVALLEHVGQWENLTEPRGLEEEEWESILSGVREAEPELRTAGREFPVRLAVALRSIIERGQA
jgi:hypothetical protein